MPNDEAYASNLYVSGSNMINANLSLEEEHQMLKLSSLPMTAEVAYNPIGFWPEPARNQADSLDQVRSWVPTFSSVRPKCT